MNRLTFLRNLLGAGLMPAACLAHPAATTDLETDAQRVRRELLEAWVTSEKTTLITAGQMPADAFDFRYSPEAMTYAEQWKHCCQFTVSQLAGRLGVVNPYETREWPTTMTKPQVLNELKTMYAFVRQTILAIPDAKLVERDDYLGSPMPNWRLFYAMENHIIHHRGQCMVYLRLKGVTPEGYLGW